MLTSSAKLGTADSKFPKNNLGKHCWGYVTLRGHASLKTTLISEDRWSRCNPVLGVLFLSMKNGIDKPKSGHWEYTATRCHSISSVQSLSRFWLCNPMDCSTPGLPVHHQLLEFTQTHVHWVGDGIQPSHPLSSTSPPAFNLSQHQGLFQWVHSSHQVAKVLDFQLQHQSFQWIFRTDLI